MGEYLSIFYSIQRKIYEKNLAEAKKELQALLNQLNDDLQKSTDENVKRKSKGAIIKLIPALNDLKKGVVSSDVISLLMLDPSKLNAKPEVKQEAPVVSPSVAPVVEDVVPTDVVVENKPKEESKGKKQRSRAKKELTPLFLEDYIGQEKAKQNLKIAIAAAKKENRVLNHLLICSSYGLGKTTLANIIANEMDLPFFTVNAINLKDTKSLSLYFSKIKESCIIFVDEIHSLRNDVQTLLLSILTDYAVSYINEAGEEEYYELPQFTLIGATTQAGELLKPFLNRFSIIELVDYTEEEKNIIVKSKFDKLGYEITDDAIADVARRSRGIPRTIETFAKGIRDIALTQDTKLITKEMAYKYFVMYDIDSNGLNKNDLLILKILADYGKPMALITLESRTSIQREDIEYRYEPYLIKLGFIDKTERGRVITQKGHDYIYPPEEEVGGEVNITIEHDDGESEDVDTKVEDPDLGNGESK